MKKIILMLLAPLCVFAQELQEQQERRSLEDRKHEVKLGAVKLLAGVVAEVSYEYVQNEDFTYGGSVLFNFDRGNDYYEDFSITPFVRFYFQEKKEYGARGFFVEGFGKYASGRDLNYDYDIDFDEVDEGQYNSANLGLSVGKKWVNRTGFVFEILVGMGRKIAGPDHAPDAVFRGDLFVGYRF